VGAKEKLLAGAKTCLRERGYSRTTARDITAASGANLASIGYHYGSVDALLTAAMVDGIGDWGQSFALVMGAGDVPPDLAAAWTQVLRTFSEHRAMLLASFEAFVQSEHLPELRSQLAAAYEQGREGLAGLFLGPDAGALSAEDLHAVGSVSLAMMTGFISQWMTDPERAPTGDQVATAIRLLAGRVSEQALAQE